MKTCFFALIKRTRPALLLSLIALTTGLYGCTTANIIAQSPPRCEFGDIVIDSDFPAGRIDGCSKRGDAIILSLVPENTPINASPWYAFKVSGPSTAPVQLVLNYTHHKHRYRPKISTDGKHWTELDANSVKINKDKTRVSLSVTPSPQGVWVSAQEIFDNEQYERWYEQLTSAHSAKGLTRQPMGESTQGRPITLLDIHPPHAKRYIVLVGRQHPPEVTGALAMTPFVERLLEDDALARDFRAAFGILMIPNMNPDGVARGNWRHNVGGIDLNRDWGPFTQKETQLVRDEMLRFKQDDAPQLYLFLDFHSTWRDIFYTQTPDMTTFPPEFTRLWLDDFAAALKPDYPDYAFEIKPGHNPDKKTSKAYMHAQFGIPAITFELGDNTDRAFIRDYARRAATTMMQRLLLIAEAEKS